LKQADTSKVSTTLNKKTLFSAKDAKDAKIYCYFLLIAASNNHCGKFSIQAGLKPLNYGFQIMRAMMA